LSQVVLGSTDRFRALLTLIASDAFEPRRRRQLVPGLLGRRADLQRRQRGTRTGVLWSTGRSAGDYTVTVP
jgi:hypothetical protein